MMSRPLLIRLAVGLLATTMLTSVAVLSGPLHDEEAQETARPSDGPDPIEGRPIVMPPGLVALEVALGLKDRSPTDWAGEVKLSEGRVVGIEVVRSGGTAKVEGNRFTVRTERKAAKKKKKQQAGLLGPIVRISLDAPATAQVTLTTGPDTATFGLDELALGRPKPFREGAITVERQDAAVRLTGAQTEDDFPAAARAADGTIWLASVAYRPDRPHLSGQPTSEQFDTLSPQGNGDQVRLRRFDGRAWQPPVDVTGPGLDVWRPAVAVDGRGVVHVAWAQQVDGNWDIYQRAYTPAKDGQAGRWSDVVRVTDDPGSDFHVVAATDAKGTVWLAWQGFRGGHYDIFALPWGVEGRPGRVATVSQSQANDWSPAIAADGRGRVYVAWDTYDRGQYDVRLRVLGSGDDAPAEPVVVAGSPRFEARCSLACDADGRLWIAYEEGDPQWGKDYSTDQFPRIPFDKNPGFGLYNGRTVRVKCLVDGKLRQPAARPELGGSNTSVPRLAVDGSGGLWLSYRHHPLPSGAGEVWVSSAVRFDGRAWSSPRRLPNSTNLIDNRPTLTASGPGIVVVGSGDNRTNTQSRGQSDLFATLIEPAGPAEAPMLIADEEPAGDPLPAVHPNEAQDIARMRAYRVEVGGRSLRLLRGEFHRHTEVSSHRDQDGLLEDSWRYALDAGGLDWMGNGDHMNGANHEYMWWFIQKMTDLHHNAPRFVAAHTYERSAVYPNGHRNVMMPRRGIRPLPFGVLAGTPEQGAPDTKVLYAYLKHFGGICAVHTSATNMGTDWRDNDPEVEPIVEIYQGHRHNYEHPGAPRAPTAETQIGGYQPAGFVWNALEKGYKLGFQSSSDHVSTHWSYAVALAEGVSRQAIIDAFKKRHCYAATDNILLVVRSGDHLMGDAFTTRERPRLEITAHGATPIAKLHVIRDNKYVFSSEPNDPRVQLRFTDEDPALQAGSTHYYYVRVQQSDGNLAWGSPLWITYQP